MQEIQKATSGSATYKVKFNIQWHTEFPCVEAVKNDPLSFNCAVCQKNVSCHHGGKGDVRDHVEKKNSQGESKSSCSEATVDTIICCYRIFVK